MFLICLLPDNAVGPQLLARIQRQLAFHWGAAVQIQHACSPDRLQAWQDILPEVAPWTPAFASDIAPGQILVCVLEHSLRPLPEAVLPWMEVLKVHTLNEAGQLIDRSGAGARQPDSHLASHVFNRLGPDYGPFGSYFHFPYGYLYRYPGMGPIDAFGFRIDHDLSSLTHRGGQHRVVAVFGGSAAWDMFCLPPDTFTQRLENLLNLRAQEDGSGLAFTVLNFGQHGHVVLNEMLAYLLWADRLRPEAVIAHDGFNDLLYGATTDPFLLQEAKLTYQNNLEPWSQLLHGTQDRRTTQAETPYQSVNLPHQILSAYIERKLQFHDLVTARGGHFIWATQPFAQSKQELSAEEQAQLLHGIGASIDFRAIFQKMPFLYEQLAKIRLPGRVGNILDLHTRFAAYGAERTLFCDIVHQNAEANELIAQDYFNLLWPTLGRRQKEQS